MRDTKMDQFQRIWEEKKGCGGWLEFVFIILSFVCEEGLLTFKLPFALEQEKLQSGIHHVTKLQGAAHC